MLSGTQAASHKKRLSLWSPITAQNWLHAMVSAATCLPSMA
jgi:hypothetical protein